MCAVRVIDPAPVGVGGDQLIRELSDLHVASKPQARCEGKRAADSSGLLVEYPFNGSNGIGRCDFLEAPKINGAFA